MKPLVIHTCPICGSSEIRPVRRDITSRRGGEAFVARDIEVEECPNCGERLFSPEALDAIESQRSRGAQRRRRRSA